MTLLEIILIAEGVSMDAFAVSVCKGLSVSSLSPRHAMSVGIWFGGFQALMPLIGYFVGIHFADFVSSVDHWISFLLLGFIGYKMLKEARESVEVDPDFSFNTMLTLSVATSIDALAVGVSLAFLRVDIWSSILLIGFVTGIFSIVGAKIGNVFGSRYKSAAEIAGGIILIIIGTKILIEHLIQNT